VIVPTESTELHAGDVLLVDLFRPDVSVEALRERYALEVLPLRGEYFADRSQEIGMAEDRRGPGRLRRVHDPDFLSPVNTLVVGPGNYTFGDFRKVGVPFTLLVMVVCVILVPILFPLYR
jgi:hypothetical protein